MFWSKEAEAFMRENYPYHSNEWMADAIEQRFGERLKCGAIRQKAYRMGIKLSNERRSEASKEHQIANIGKVTAWNKGYKHIRTENGWVNYGKYMLEQATCEVIPDGYAVVFADGDNENYSVENLVAVPIGWQILIAQNKWVDEMLNTALIWLRLHDLCYGRNGKAIRIMEKEEKGETNEAGEMVAMGYMGNILMEVSEMRIFTDIQKPGCESEVHELSVLSEVCVKA